MEVTNRDIAAVFNEIAELLDIEGANPFRIRAYRNAARTVLAYPKEMHTLVEEGFDLSSIRTIGKDLSAKITELVRTGRLKFLDDLRYEVPPGLEELLHIPGMGPKRVQMLHESYGIGSAAELEKALENGILNNARGFGPQLLQMLRKEVGKNLSEPKRSRLDQIAPIADRIVRLLGQSEGVKGIEVAGSIRRRRDDPKDIDIVASCDEPNTLMKMFTGMPEVQSVVMSGSTRSSVILRNGIHVDLRAIAPEHYAATLHHFTGSKAHNIALRTRAAEMGLKINEYGVFRGDERLDTKSEESLYCHLGLPYIVPELREDRGEIEAALAGRLPTLIRTDQIRGDLHIHTDYSDGINSLEQMADAARMRGYEYIAITDHSRRLKIAHGLDEERLLEQIAHIERLNERNGEIRILKSAEVDILEDGSLDLSDAVLSRLDFAVCAIHYRFNLSSKEQTSRILKAMENPLFTVLAHPSGRLLGLREPYPLDMETIIRACGDQGIILELNAQPDRLDLNDFHCRMAKEAGAQIALSTDAHSIRDLELMEYGIGQARRGWLEPGDIVNTLPLASLLKVLRRRR